MVASDPNLVDANDPIFYQSPQPGMPLQDYGRRTATQLAKDVNAAHDVNRKLVAKTDRLESNQIVLNAQNVDLKDRVKWMRIWNLIMTFGWLAVVWTIKQLVPLALKGMSR